MTSSVTQADAARGKTVVLVGLGNIGSQLLPLLVRAPEIERLVLVDPDSYHVSNLRGQNVRARDVGLTKVDAMARLSAEVCGEVEVVTHARGVEDVPLALLRGDVLASCVDSRRARQTNNSVAWRLGMVMIDAAVQAENQLARVAVYQPGLEQPCLTCRWSAEDYNLLEPVYGCAGPGAAMPPTYAANVPPTNAAPELGSLVAAYQAMAVRRSLAGDDGFAGHELFVSARHHTMTVARFSHNPSCRFDHQTLGLIERHAGEHTTVGELVASLGVVRLNVPGHSFVFEAACGVCVELGAVCPTLTREMRLPLCPQCGGKRTAAGQSMREWLPLAQQPAHRRLAEFGLRAGDVVSATRPTPSQTAETIYLELGRTS
jgi:hypothetical protein